MKMSKYKLDIIKEVTAADESQSMLSYAFPLMRYHDRWKEINLAEDKPEPLLEHSFKKGNVYLREIAPQAYPENFMEPTEKPPPLTRAQRAILKNPSHFARKRTSPFCCCICRK